MTDDALYFGGDSQFGWSVSVDGDGDTLAAGAPYESSSATGVGGREDYSCLSLHMDNCTGLSGAAYVFNRSPGGAWSPQSYIKASNTGGGYYANPDPLYFGDAFGWSVSLSSDALAVGAYLEFSNATGVNNDQTNNDAPLSGAVYVY